MEQLIHGDCLEKLKAMPDDSIDAIVTDPPAGIEFMGKDWDSFKDNKRSKGWACQGKEGGNDFGGFGKTLKPSFYALNSSDLQNFQDFICEVMTECLRVLKPGGYAIVWAIPRTSHHTAMGIERAGFEIRDVIHHVFGSGFPKNHDIGKAVDKLQGNEREDVGKYVPPNGKEWNLKQDADENIDCASGTFTASGRRTLDITKGNSEWEGWGTALKPSTEHWILARKPLKEKTVAENVLKYGTGAINIDGCRIPVTSDDEKDVDRIINRNIREEEDGWGMQDNTADRVSVLSNQGRYPANVVVQDDALNDGENSKSGFMKAGTNRLMSENPNKTCYGEWKSDTVSNDTYGDEGSKSRYFDIELWAKTKGIIYVPKASRSEKNAGLDEFEEKQVNDGRKTDIDNAFQRGDTLRKNTHPTVKSINLMSYLITLVSKEKMTILDPFMGSGTTGVACKLLDRNFIGIEKDKEYLGIAEARINHVPAVNNFFDEI